MLTDLIKSTSEYITDNSKHVSINQEALDTLVQKIKDKPVYINFFEYSEHIDITEDEEILIAYGFVLDALNFCFWGHTWEYGELAGSIKAAYKKNPEFLTPAYLANISYDEVKAELFAGEDFPLLDERTRALNEIGAKTVAQFDGKFSNILKKANFDAQQLLEVISSTFLMFQDHCIYNGRQVYFYKRAQILIGDLYAMFRDKPDCQYEMKNIQQITCFADYRIPQILAHEGVLVYSDELKTFIDEQKVMPYGSDYEVEIRGCMIQAVEILKTKLNAVGVNWNSAEVDWLLWQIGEEQKDEIAPHHKVLSIFY